MSIDQHGTTPTPDTGHTTPTPGTPAGRPGRRLQQLGGLCLATGPLLLVAGIVTSPPQDGASSEAYAASLAAVPTQAAVSANLLHYSWLLLALGILASLSLVTGRRGRVMTSVCAIGGVIGAFQISGLLLNDFYLVRLSDQIGVAQTAAALEGLGTSVDIWMLSAKVLAILVLPLTFVGLARARVLPWWSTPLPLLGYVVPALGLPDAAIWVVAAVSWLPAYLAARRLIAGPAD